MGRACLLHYYVVMVNVAQFSNASLEDSELTDLTGGGRGAEEGTGERQLYNDADGRNNGLFASLPGLFRME